MKKPIILVCILTGLSFPAAAQQSGFDIFNFAPLPSTLALSEATTAVPDGSGSVFVNPALLTMNETSSIDLGYSRMIGDANNIFGGVNLKQDNKAFAFTVYRSGDDGFEQRNQPGASNGTFSVNYLSLGASAARAFGPISAGITAQYNHEEVYLDKSDGYSFNFGLVASLANKRLTLAASLVNLGKMNKLVATEPILPTAVRIGGAFDVLKFTPPKNSNLPILASVSADYVIPAAGKPEAGRIGYYDDEAFANFGLNLNVAGVVEVKGGYKTGNTARPVSFGVGIITEILAFNYALIPYETGFGTVHSIGIQYKF